LHHRARSVRVGTCKHGRWAWSQSAAVGLWASRVDGGDMLVLWHW